VNFFLCQLGLVLRNLLTAYIIVLFVYALVSWVPNLRGRWVYYLAAIVEPLLTPLRRIIPPLGGLDLSFLVLILLIQLVLKPLLNASILNTCFRPF
jgi:YggT family protein